MSNFLRNLLWTIGGLGVMCAGCAGLMLVDSVEQSGRRDTTELAATGFVVAAAVSRQDPVLTLTAIEAVQKEIATLDIAGLAADDPGVASARESIALGPVVEALHRAQRGAAAGHLGDEVQGLMDAQARWAKVPEAGRWQNMAEWMAVVDARMAELRQSHPEDVARIEAIAQEVQATVDYIERCGNRYKDPDKWETAIITKLRETLHDPGTAELLGCGEWQMTASCYERTCRLRAKNAFGVFVVGDVHVTAAKGEVVDIQLE